ncbi:MAG: porin [Candidatus Omnitrophota bacterium]
MKSLSRIVGVLSLIAILPISGQVYADSVSIEQRLADLEQQVAILKRQIEVDKEGSSTKSKETPIITASAKDGFSIKSPDDNFKLKVGGYVQADARFFTNNKKDSSYGTSSFYARRVRPVFSGTVAHDFNFNITPDFSSSSLSIVDAYAEYAKFPAFKIRAGKFKAPFSIENLQDSRFNNFAEAGLPANLYPNRELGVQVSGSLLKDSLTYGVGLFNGAFDADKYSSTSQSGDNNNDKEIVGRLFIQPFKNTSLSFLSGLGVGYAASFGHEEGASAPNSYISPGQVNQFAYSSGITANGPHIRTSPQASYYYKSFGLLGEYVDSAQDLSKGSGNSLVKDKFHNKAWQISGTYVLTGEDATYAGVTPRHDFDWANGYFGALELAGRYGSLRLDRSIFNKGFSSGTTNISGETAWAAGLNWYLNKNVKTVLDFEHTQFDHGVAANITNGNRKSENVVTSRLQLSF